jgi:hypothetical protein
MKKYAVVALLILLILYYVYPTRYLYLPVATSLRSTDPGQFPVRIDRLTGETQILWGELGWKSTENPN